MFFLFFLRRRAVARSAAPALHLRGTFFWKGKAHKNTSSSSSSPLPSHLTHTQDAAVRHRSHAGRGGHMESRCVFHCCRGEKMIYFFQLFFPSLSLSLALSFSSPASFKRKTHQTEVRADIYTTLDVRAFPFDTQVRSGGEKKGGDFSKKCVFRVVRHAAFFLLDFSFFSFLTFPSFSPSLSDIIYLAFTSSDARHTHAVHRGKPRGLPGEKKKEKNRVSRA